MCDRVRVYLEIWSRIEKIYFDEYMVYESGFQAALYEELRKTLPGVNVVAEPVWRVGEQKQIMRPDLVIVEKGQITDIFELKFKPAEYPPFKEDIKKLLQYGADWNETYLVRLNPNTGRPGDELPVRNNCRLHFVVVANYDAGAVWPTSLRGVMRALKEETPGLRENPRVLSHWFGRVGDNTDERRKWSIEVGIR